MKIRFSKNDAVDTKGVMGDATPSIEKGLLLALYDAVSRKSGSTFDCDWEAVTGYNRNDLMNVLSDKIHDYIDNTSQGA